MCGKNCATTRSRQTSQYAGVAQLVEQLICNQQVGGSSPFAGSVGEKKEVSIALPELFYKVRAISFGEMAERSMAADCKSAGGRLRRFESFSPHFAGVVQW